MSKADDALSAESFRRLVRYDPGTGTFTVLVASNNGLRKIGDEIGGANNSYRDRKGYVRLGFRNHLYLAHRLAWLWYYGAWPADQIDHVNHVRDDNRITNLRECTNAENRQNLIPRGYGASGFLGVHWTYKSKSRPWVAKLIVKGEKLFSGHYATAEEASKAYLKAKARLRTFAATGVSELERADV